MKFHLRESMLYKYLSIDSKSYKGILEKREVFFSLCSKLNDPFEGAPRYTMPSKTAIKRHLISRGATGQRKKLKKIVERAVNDLEFNKEKLSKDNKIKDFSAVLCLTPHFNNLLMWSHYGDSHKGICIGFDIVQPTDPVFGCGYEVDYSDSYPEISLLDMDSLLADREKNYANIDKFDHIPTMQIYTKAKCWEYEHEVRFVRTIYSGGEGSMKFPAFKLREVILGCNISDKSKEKTIEIISRNYPDAKIILSKKSSTNYKINFFELGEVK